jgi:hypothetical protein
LDALLEGSDVDPDPESDPKLFAGSGVGSGINHFGSGQPLSRMHLNKTSDKIHNFSTKCTININKKNVSKKIYLKNLC